MAKPLNIAVFASGRGSNFQAILESVDKKILDVTIKVVITDNPEAKVLTLLDSREEIAVRIVDRKQCASRADFEAKILRHLADFELDLIVLAGFMRILSADFVNHFAHKIINIHPSLLPAFPGLHAQKQALEYGVKFAGCTVHFVNHEVDGGAIILQAVVPVLDDDTEATLSARILAQEHRILTQAISLLGQGKLQQNNRKIMMRREDEFHECMSSKTGVN